MPNQTEQKTFNKALRPEEVENDRLHAEDDLYDVIHKTEITICYVQGSDQGTRVYGFYIEDSEGLKKPIGIELSIWPDGSIHTKAGGNPLEMLGFLKPEAWEQLEREEHEEFQREQQFKHEHPVEYIASLEKQYEEEQDALQRQTKKVLSIAYDLRKARGEPLEFQADQQKNIE